MSEDKAWACPSCGRGVAPGVQTCDHGGQALNPFGGPWPFMSPGSPLLFDGMCNACRNGGVCNCVRPERAASIAATIKQAEWEPVNFDVITSKDYRHGK